VRSRVALRWIERGLFAAGLLLAGLWLRDYRSAYAFQSSASQRLDAAPRRDSTGGAAKMAAGHDSTAAADSGGALGRIEIPRLRISAMIGEGTDQEVLDRAVGHVTSTARPGQAGNVGLAGHRDTFFRGLGGVREQDLIRIVTVGGTYSYRVQWSAIVEPRRVDVLDSTASPSVTLVTCYPFRWVGPAPRRFVVRAVLAEPTAATRP
jgi:sortase A